MMTRAEHLLKVMAMQCVILNKSATRARRQGADSIQAGHSRTNAQRVNDDLMDLMAVCEMLHDCGVLSSLQTAVPDYATRAREVKDREERQFVLLTTPATSEVGMANQ